MLCCRLTTFFKITSSKILSGTLSESHTIWIQFRTDLGTNCLGYQTTKVTASNERDNDGGGGYFACLCDNTCTVKPVLSGHSKIDKTKVLKTNGSLLKVESIAGCSPWSILQYF